jgi:CxxC motif-containing protein (DUF1111 family)
MRNRLMHDGASTSLGEAIKRHGGEAHEVRERFDHLSTTDREALLEFLRSL